MHHILHRFHLQPKTFQQSLSVPHLQCNRHKFQSSPPYWYCASYFFQFQFRRIRSGLFQYFYIYEITLNIFGSTSSNSRLKYCFLLNLTHYLPIFPSFFLSFPPFHTTVSLSMASLHVSSIAAFHGCILHGEFGKWAEERCRQTRYRRHFFCQYRQQYIRNW